MQKVIQSENLILMKFDIYVFEQIILKGGKNRDC